MRPKFLRCLGGCRGCWQTIDQSSSRIIVRDRGAFQRYHQMSTADGIHVEQTESGQMAISHSELVNRYRENYGFADDAGITAEMVLKHWDLEKEADP